MQRFIRVSVRTSGVAILLSCIWALGLCRPSCAAAQSAVEAPVYLDQGWLQADREMFYQTSQGSRTISYDIFLNLEVADNPPFSEATKNIESVSVSK